MHPGGDSYFGGLLNSWIHVMMYSYYTLSLFKIQCPWKKYLTMAQLGQFCTVLLYSFVSMLRMPEDATWKNYTVHAVQVFEMASLFVLFLHFYKKSYRKKSGNQKRTSGDSDATPETAEQDSISTAASAGQ